MNRTRFRCEFTPECLVFCIGMVLVCLEGPYLVLRSLAEAQMTTLTHTPPTPDQRPAPGYGLLFAMTVCATVVCAPDCEFLGVARVRTRVHF